MITRPKRSSSSSERLHTTKLSGRFDLTILTLLRTRPPTPLFHVPSGHFHQQLPHHHQHNPSSRIQQRHTTLSLYMRLILVTKDLSLLRSKRWRPRNIPLHKSEEPAHCVNVCALQSLDRPSSHLCHSRLDKMHCHLPAGNHAGSRTAHLHLAVRPSGNRSLRCIWHLNNRKV